MPTIVTTTSSVTGVIASVPDSFVIFPYWFSFSTTSVTIALLPSSVSETFFTVFVIVAVTLSPVDSVALSPAFTVYFSVPNSTV